MPGRRRTCVLAAAAAVFAAGGGPALAAYCTEPTAPWVPTPSWANQDTMTKADAEIGYYLQAVAAYIECLQDAIAAADAKRKDVLAQWQWTIDNLPGQ